MFSESNAEYSPRQGSDWRSKFTTKQLQRKRLVDRFGQKRTREHNKRNMAKLEERIQLLLQGEHSTLFRNVMQENAALWATLDHYENKMGTILLCSADCLGLTNIPLQASNTEHAGSAAKGGEHSQSQSLPAQPDPTAVDVVCTRLAQDKALPFLSLAVFHGLPGRQQIQNYLLEQSTDDIIEHVNSWKIVANHGLGFNFLVDQFGLDKAPMNLSADKIKQRVLSKTFYKDTIKKLISPSPSFGAPSPDHQDNTSVQVSEMECQRRAILLCACEMTRGWRLLYQSSVACLATFWLNYRLLTFLTFPCRENLLQLPAWLWPSPAQLSREHPGFIDFLVWPNLRNHLVDNWYIYNIKVLAIQLAQNFTLLHWESLNPDDMLIVLDDPFEFRLKQDFASHLSDLNNFGLSPDFYCHFPDLQPVSSDGCTSVQGGVDKNAQPSCPDWGLGDRETRSASPKRHRGSKSSSHVAPLNQYALHNESDCDGAHKVSSARLGEVDNFELGAIQDIGFEDATLSMDFFDMAGNGTPGI
ncbi:uncharacterized protein Z518_03601 [Rhinocladiella mackenziei CBS 650.93]|uniref:Rhinocladiella mackenziei CBS 650.93 unplaced genomic scaffold supercont1.3, whole genome shotgun sequence n=1 Tax=Rhinocladiella mackenziei CBS 650.93 TaxID=1442369 RepID=A0A0D2IIR1_9EURO|nr:uncharacterized protein Z518_03601 [Rhinocladiella mackenziei CBS 650.93]KIX05629.1 hypothetical protein Z518_03601 [Rhinocladiella mackenziei CBS 650.93]